MFPQNKFLFALLINLGVIHSLGYFYVRKIIVINLLKKVYSSFLNEENKLILNPEVLSQLWIKKG